MMLRKTVSRSLVFGMIVVFLATMAGTPALGQDTPQDAVAVEPNTAVMEAPVHSQAVLSDKIPELTPEQAARLEWGVQNSSRSIDIPAAPAAEVAGPVPGTESQVMTMRPRSGAPLAPGDAQTYHWTNFGAAIPAGYKSNVMEMSTDGKSQLIFATGNWFAARSVDKGRNFSFVNPYSDYPDFCCDQVFLFDVNRDMYLWLRMASPNASGVNTFKLSVDTHDNFGGGYWTYTTAPTNTNGAWTNQWWDYPHMQLGADYLYIAWNMFDAAGNWTRTVMLRWPLDALAAAAGFSYNYYDQATYFTFVPVSGAQHEMYFASNWAAPWNTLRIWRWDENTGSLVFWTKTVATWTLGGRGSYHCGTPNWLARTDQRVLTGALYKVNHAGVAGDAAQIGRMVLGWWWNVPEGGGFPYPYIEGAAFYEDNMVQLPSYIGRPYVYGGWCFAYPSFTPNIRGDLGGVFNYSTPPNYQIPNVAFSIADEFWGSPPGWAVYGAAGGSGGSSSATWGDYNTTRTYQLGTTWLAGTHFIPTAGNCSNCAVPLWFSFGRERDNTNFRWW